MEVSVSKQKSSGDVEVKVDAAARSPLRRIWRYVGYDEPNYTYTANGRELLGKLGAMSDSPYYIRCHFILCTGDGTGRPKWGSTNAYTEDGEGNPKYSFDIVDKILDTQIETGCVPFVEIGFMPQALSTAPPEVPYAEIRDAGWAYPPRDYSRWADLVRELARHCLDRYGLQEVSRWYWELWNEPDIFYWAGTTREFCRLYDYTQWALHSVIPQAILGGPAVTGPNTPKAGQFLEDFLEHCTHGENAVTGKTGTRLDMVTVHAKGGGYKPNPDAPKETPTMKRLVDHVDAGLKILEKFPELKGVEVNLSECDPDGWAAGGKHDNPNMNFRNTEYYSSYVANTVCQLIDLNAHGANQVDGMITWAFEFEDREYFEGLRTLSTNGIDKAVLNVFRLLGKLGGIRVELNGAESDSDKDANLSAIAATNETGAVQVFISNHHDDWDVRESSTVNLSIGSLLPNTRYTARYWLVDRDNANPYTPWLAMGSPQKLSADQEKQLRVAATLKPVDLPEVTSDKSGNLSFSQSLFTHAACLVELNPQVE